MSSPLDLKDHERLAIESEQEILLNAVNAPSGQGRLYLDFEDEAQMSVLEERLGEGWQILHYSGHGISPENGGGLLLEDSQGNQQATGVVELLPYFSKVGKDLRLVVLSGCQTARTINQAGFQDLARGLLGRGIPSVMAMQFSITDQAGLLLAENLYGKIVNGATTGYSLKRLPSVITESRKPTSTL